MAEPKRHTDVLERVSDICDHPPPPQGREHDRNASTNAGPK